ncbi:hypothetical protein [Methanococcoides vulcani]|nr:hypothetical protein [Methanococcoides vulcani]
MYKKGEVKAALEDADGDGDIDLVLHFKPDRDELPGLVVGDGAI